MPHAEPPTLPAAMARSTDQPLQGVDAAAQAALTLPNVVLPPHTAGTTPEALMHGLNLCAANVVAFLQGQGQHRVV